MRGLGAPGPGHTASRHTSTRPVFRRFLRSVPRGRFPRGVRREARRRGGSEVRAIATLLLRCPVTGGELHLLVDKGEPAPLPAGVSLEAYDGWELATLLANSNLMG